MFKELNAKNVLKIVGLSYLLIMLFVGGYFLYQRYSNRNLGGGSQDTALFPENPNPGDPGYREPDREREVDESGVFSGRFIGFSAGKISIANEKERRDFDLPDGEVAIQCVSQLLDGATSIDLDKVQQVLRYRIADLNGAFEVGEPLIVFISEDSGLKVVHTIAVTYSSCPPDQKYEI